MLALMAFIVFITNSERRIPVQYAKRVVGRKMYGGQSTNLPIKVNMSGVLPIIFAQSIASLPATIVAFTGTSGSFWTWMNKYVFDTKSAVYIRQGARGADADAALQRFPGVIRRVCYEADSFRCSRRR